MAKTGAIAKLEAMTQDLPSYDAKALKELVASGGDVPANYKGREHVWAKKVKKFAEGGKVEDKAYIGYRRAGRRPESQQNREASANIPVAVARGLVSGTLGLPGDIESLARMPYELITGKESKTILPTSEDIEKRLPFRGSSQTPVGQMFTGAGQLAGGAYTGPLSGARAVMAVPRAAVRAGRDFVQAAGQNVSPLTVYHGSPHKFAPTPKNPLGEFDAKKIGTGEGAQAYGHGHYLAEAPGVAKQYQTALSDFDMFVDGKPFNPDIPAHRAALEIKQRGGKLAREEVISTYKKQIEDLRSRGHKWADDLAKSKEEELKVFESEKIPEYTEQTKGHLYKVDLPDEKIARMLDWDKPLSQQPEVIKALKGTDYEVGMSQREAEKVADMRLRQEADEWADMTGGDPVDYINNADWEKYVDQVRKESGSIDSSITGKDLHRMIMRDEGYRPELFDPENYQIGASEALRGYGIPGIRYLDASSRDAGKGTSNFVVFPGEEGALTILERKKEGGEVKMAEGGAAFGRYTTGRKYQGAVKRAKEADVNKLPDPRTYAAVMGLLGSAPDELGFSVMHPDYKGIQKAGERGFVGGTILGVAPVVAPLTRGLPVGAAIKPVGGNWLTGSVERALEPLKTRTIAGETPAQRIPRHRALLQDPSLPPESKATVQRHLDEEIKRDAIDQWVNRNLTNYVKKQMATPDDPVRELAERGITHMPSDAIGRGQWLSQNMEMIRRGEGFPVEGMARTETGRGWENLADEAIQITAPVVANKEMLAANPWLSKLNPNQSVYRAREADFSELNFDHIIDVLKQDLDAGRIRPEQLNKVSMEQAVRRTAEFDQEMAKRMREAQIKATEGMPVYREYPEGYRWIELATPSKLPEKFAVSEKNGRFNVVDSTTGDPLLLGRGQTLTSFGTPEEAVSAYYKQNPKVLEDALKYEGDTMGHCVGGYCPDVLEGRSRIYSLRDAKGEPHVTVEVQPPEIRGGQSAEEWLATPHRIVQIKGKQNRAPNEQYLPFVQDFVRGGKWSGVGDIQNTGLYRKGDFIDEFTPEQLDAVGKGEYLTMDEIKKLREGKPWKPIDRDPELDIDPNALGMKAGGAVDCGCKEEPKMQAGGIAALKQLLRAPAKSKQEIEEVARRVAPQVTGEFVRGSKGTASVADKTQKQFAREKDLPVEFTDVKKVPPKRVVSPQELKGKVVTGIPGDPTVTGKSLVRVGDTKLELPSPQHGGPLYGLGRNDDIFWASGIGPAGGVQRVAREAMEAYDAPVVGQYIMMGPDSINYAQHFADANLQAIDLSKMSKKQIEGFNKLIRFGDEKSGPRPGFPGIEDKIDSYLHFSMDPHLRRHFNRLMQMPTITEKFNLPSGQDIRYAVTEAPLRNMETGVTGYSMGELAPDITKSMLPLSAHPTYSHDIPGRFIGGLKYPTPYELTFPDTLMSVRANPKQARQEFGSLKMVGPRQIYDQQMIDELMMYEEAMKKYTGKKKGGKVGALSAVEKV